MKSEHCEDIVESGEISLESEPEAESSDCKEIIKLEIKQEIQDTGDVQDPLSTKMIEQDLHISIGKFKVEDNV